MKSYTEKKIRQLKNKSVAPPIIKLLLAVITGALAVVGIMAASIGSIFQSKLNDSLRDALVIREYIDEHLGQGESYEEILSDIEEMANHPVAINVFDENIEVIEMYGDELNLQDVASTGKELTGIYSVSKVSGKIKPSLILLDRQVINDFVNGVISVFSLDESKQFISKEVYSYEYWIDPIDSIGLTDSTLISFDTGDINYVIFSNVEDPEDLIDEEVDIDDVGEDDNENLIYMKYCQHIYANDIFIFLMVITIAAIIFFIIVVVLFIRSIVDIVRQRMILNLLLKDQVTGGNNLLSFEQFSARTLRRSMRRNFAMVDFSLLRYQNYCTLYGIEEGEKLLKAIDKIISRKLGRGEIVARVGSADFAILMSDKNNPNYEEEYINRLKEIINELPDGIRASYRRVLQGLTNISFAAGVYVMGAAKNREGKLKRINRSNNIDQLRMKAEIAKQGLGGEAGVMKYNHKMWEDELWAQKVEDMMQRALDNQEFQVYIQPKYHPSTEELKGGEALVRWISPTEGFISPGQFIPIFEKNGFITKLDDYMITHTAELQAKWLAAGKKIVPVSVNVSRLHFSQLDLAEHINALVDQYELPHKFIEIELTESAFFDDKKALLTTVRKLQEYGFAVSMDDFGAGYSSLNSLKDLPLNVLKLDADFFRGDDFGSRGEIVVSEAITLAKLLNMKIVAEGVEKKEQVDFLAKQDCDMIQGYYFAKPMPADEYETRMKSTADEVQKTDDTQKADEELKADDAQKADEQQTDGNTAEEKSVTE